MVQAVTARLADQVALVFGAGHGIGRAVAHRLLAEGAQVMAADLDADALAQTLQGYDQERVLALECDVTNRESVDAAVQAGVAWAGGLDIVANVVGKADPHPDLAEMTDEVWTAELDVNLTGVMRCIRAALPHLEARGGGAIVSIGSVNGLTAFGSEPYSAAKAGLSSLTRNLAVDLGPRGIRINVIAPGTVRTRVWQGKDERVARMAGLAPLGRIGEPEDVAAALAFLVSDDASWITGVTLPVDGGMTTGPYQVIRAERPPG